MSQRRGFSMIEVMVVVGIAGILASIAIPAYADFGRRAKIAERKVVVSALMRDATQLFEQTSSWPWGTGPGSTTWNPPLPANGVFTKEKWDTTDPAWSRLTFAPAQAVWCRYLLHTGSPATVVYVDVACDLDKDGDVCTYSEGYDTEGSQLLTCSGASPSPLCAGHVPQSGFTSGDNDCGN